MNKLLPLCILTLVVMLGCVQSSKSYASSHPMDGLQLKMQYCIDMQRYEDKPLEDIGCKVGHGSGKVGVKKDIIKQLVERINMNKHSYAYKQLVSDSGLMLVFKDDSVGAKGKAVVWEDSYGNVSSTIEKDE